MVGRLVSFWEGLFSASMLVLGSVYYSNFSDMIANNGPFWVCFRCLGADPEHGCTLAFKLRNCYVKNLGLLNYPMVLYCFVEWIKHIKQYKCI